jgi:hypothetical protein
MTELKSWFKENHTIVIFLIAQMIALGIAGASMMAYFVRLETRTSIMETRGAEYTVARMEEMKTRIAILEQGIRKNEAQIERIIDMLTREIKR